MLMPIASDASAVENEVQVIRKRGTMCDCAAGAPLSDFGDGRLTFRPVVGDEIVPANSEPSEPGVVGQVSDFGADHGADPDPGTHQLEVLGVRDSLGS